MFPANIIYHIISYHIISYHIISYHIISYHTITFFLGWYCVLLEVRFHNKISYHAFYSKIKVLIFPDLYFNGNLEWFSPRSVPGSLTERPFLGKVLSSLSNGFLIWATKRHEIEKEGLGFEDFTSSSTKKKVKVNGEHFCKYGAGLKVCKYQSQVQTSSEVWSWTPSVGNTSSSYLISYLLFTFLWQTDILWYITT